ncbi:MAG: sulfatase [Sedimentisphaerales bacterium]|nr:sulfatase [Sedimentisphaerales bacterium]
MTNKLNRRDFLKAASFSVAALTAPGLLSVAKAKLAKPLNFVFFLIDDFGWKDLGCYGSMFYETPNIDRLASQGVRFTDAYAACPVCSPTRASIVAGKYPARMDTTDWFGAPQPQTAKRHKTRNKPMLPAAYLEYLPLEETTIAEALKEAGYGTFFAGKWHLGPEAKYWPENQGFDVNKGGWKIGGPYGPGKYFVPYGNPRLEDGPKGEHLPDRLATETCKFIEENKSKPFLAYLSFYSVHTPLVSRDDLKRKYQEKAKSVVHEGPRFIPEGERQVRQVQDHAVYGGMVEAMDMAVGKVLDQLEKLGIDDNTAVFFMSDNGGFSTSKGSPTSNVPLRGGKGWLYEGGIREPMIIKWPGVAKAGSTCSEPVISTDFYPTMLDIAGLKPKPAQHVDGVSLAGLLKDNKKPDREAIYWHYPHYGNQGGFPGAAIRCGDYKLIERFEDMSIELYNLKEDIGEKNNLAAKMPEKANKMRKMLHAWQKEVDAKMPTPNPAFN